jgi:hypothetical protein
MWPLHFLLEQRLAELQRRDRYDQERKTFEDQVDALLHLEIGRGVRAFPELEQREEEQSRRAHDEHHADHEVPRREHLVNEVDRRAFLVFAHGTVIAGTVPG